MADSWKDGKGKKEKRKDNFMTRRGGNFRRGDRSTDGGHRVEVYKEEERWEWSYIQE